jgi:hypothetical protein
MPDGILDLVRKPDVQDRSKEFFKVVCALKKRGWSPAEIESLFAAHPDGIASKYWNRLRQEVERFATRNHKNPEARTPSTARRRMIRKSMNSTAKSGGSPH